MKKYYGRNQEINQIINMLSENKFNSLAITGPRQVGKTTLVKQVIDEINKNNDYYNLEIDYMYFFGNCEMSSQDNISTSYYKLNQTISQIEEKYNFKLDVMKKKRKPTKWIDFFIIIIELINQLNKYHKTTHKNKQYKIILFLDEIAWFSKHKNFIVEFGQILNEYLVDIDNVLLVVSSSYSSWVKELVMSEKKSKLFYGRIKKEIFLKPFSLDEVLEYCQNKHNINITKEMLINYYLAFGGWLKYYENIDFSDNEENNFNRLIHKEDQKRNNILENEREILYRNMLNKPIHKDLLFLLCKHKTLSRNDIFELNLPEYIKKYEHEKIEKKYKHKEEEIELDEKRANALQMEIYNALVELKDMYFITEGRIRTEYEYSIYHPFVYFCHYWLETYKKKNFSQSFNTWKGNALEIATLMHIDTICKKANIENNHFILNLLIKERSNGKIDSQIDIAVVGNNTIRPTKQNPLRITIFEIKNYSSKYFMSDDDVIDIFDKCDKLKKMKLYKTDNIYINAKIITINGSKHKSDIEMRYDIQHLSIIDNNLF